VVPTAAAAVGDAQKNISLGVSGFFLSLWRCSATSFLQLTRRFSEHYFPSSREIENKRV
jgi:hypothetical protein